MATNLMQMRRLVRSRLGVPLDDDFMLDNILNDHINLALQTLDAEAHWPWTDATQAVTLTNAVPDIPPPTDWRATRAIFYEDREMELVSPGDLLRMFDVSQDIPTIWCPMSNVIAVRPKPNQPVTVTHYYYRQQVWLVDDADAPTLPGEYTGAVVAKAAELLSARESSGGDASRHGAEYTSWVNRMRRDLRRSTSSTRVRVRPGSWV